MLSAPCYVVSDTHLGVGNDDRERERDLVAFLRHLEGRAASLLINGDLFDFWFEWRSVMPRGHFRTLAALADLRDSGVDILMVAGNHDCWGGDVLTGDVGVRFVEGPITDTLGGWRTHLDHGDGLRLSRTGDTGCSGACSDIRLPFAPSAGCIRIGAPGWLEGAPMPVAPTGRATRVPACARWRCATWTITPSSTW